jgi:hypothetical protein
MTIIMGNLVSILLLTGIRFGATGDMYVLIGGGVTLVVAYFRGCINIYNKKYSFKQYPFGSTLTHVVIFFVFTQDLKVKNVPLFYHL